MMRCRYNPNEHGEFTNAVKLSQHYLADHPEFVPKAHKICPECGKPVGDIRQHLAKTHGIPGGLKAYEERQQAAKVNGAAVVHVDPEPEPAWHADQIVIPVMTQLAGGKKGTIPVAKLGAVFAWREATQTMLDQVQ